MINLKLKTIATLIDKSDTVLDIGCDHGYLAIYLKENKLCKEVYASDINENALNMAINNIKKSNLDIKTYLSDGFKSIINSSIDTAVISGVGASTILSIIDNAPKNVEKYILCSNNNHEELRTKLYKQGLYLKEEVVIKDKNKFYVIELFTKEKEFISKFFLKYGRHNNKEYFSHLIKKEKEILDSIPRKYIVTRLHHKKNIKELKKLIKRN